MKKMILLLSIAAMTVLSASAQTHQAQPPKDKTYPITCKSDSALVSIMNWDYRHLGTELHSKVSYVVQTFKVVSEHTNGAIDTSGLQEGAHTFYDSTGKVLNIKTNEIISMILVPSSPPVPAADKKK